MSIFVCEDCVVYNISLVFAYVLKLLVITICFEDHTFIHLFYSGSLGFCCCRLCNSYLVSLLCPFSCKVHLKVVMLSQTVVTGVDGLEHCLPMERIGLGKAFVITRISPLDQSCMGQTLDKKRTSLIVRTNWAPKCQEFKSPPHKG